MQWQGLVNTSSGGPDRAEQKGMEERSSRSKKPGRQRPPCSVGFYKKMTINLAALNNTQLM